jgi:hypothetical protein
LLDGDAQLIFSDPDREPSPRFENGDALAVTYGDLHDVAIFARVDRGVKVYRETSTIRFARVTRTGPAA